MRDWSKLMNSERFRPTRRHSDDARIEFERDYDRIVYCSAFRRLKDKAQVFPLEQGDYVRTRLTHSLEVSSLGRSFGVDVARKLVGSGKLKDNNATKGGWDTAFGFALSSACLVHDLGNPPFGHFGEECIRQWFEKWFEDGANRDGIQDSQLKDFTMFEGNAQTFRILTLLQFLSDEYGLNLTYGTLATMLKYPRASSEADKNSENVSYTKCGYFRSEEDRFKRLKEKTGFGEFRHPLAFALEAADDIAYKAGDIEDALKKGVITWDELVSELQKCLGKEDSLVRYVKKQYKEYVKEGFPEPWSSASQDFRIQAQTRMLRACIDVFIKNVDAILEGGFDKPLIKTSAENELSECLKEIGSRYVFASDSILRLEVAGRRVIGGLLDLFVPAVLKGYSLDIRHAEGKLYKLISPNFRFVFETWGGKKDKYAMLRLATDFISGMTDSYAVDLYQRLSGVKID